MKRNRQKKVRRNTIIFVASLFLFVGIFPMNGVVFGEEKEGIDTYRYNPEGKPDPFMPFIKTAPKNAVQEVVEKGEGGEVVKTVFLPPLQRVDVGLFKLLGIGERGETRIAMVEGSNGRFYVLRKGARIGLNNGRVTEILPDQVVVVETIKDAYGKSKSNRVILKLQRGEDEGEL